MSTLIKALERARKKEKSEKGLISDKTTTKERSEKRGKQLPVSDNRKLEVRYSKTQVQANDPQKLKKNKIFSIYDEIHATNEIKILRTKIFKKMKLMQGNSLLITSANSYEGKTFTSINLGVSIAKEFDRTVLIVDADLRKPNERHRVFSKDFFDLTVNKGLSDYLQGDAEIPEILINPGIERLTIIPSGEPVDNAPELFNSARMQTMIDELKKRYPERFVIIDTPPMNQYADAIILSRFVDGVLLVVEVEKTSSEDLKKIVANLKDARIVGTIVNKIKG